MNIEEGLDYILEHFEEPKFPRTISTKDTGNKQVLVYSREEALWYFKRANYVDCRISAFSEHEKYQVIPNLIFIDQDDTTALAEVLYEFGKIGAKPLVIATGNGFAIIQPINMRSWKNLMHQEKTGEELATMFLFFASRHLSNNKCDSGNHPSLRSCLIRVPASINSKNGKIVEVQMFWNKKRADVHSLPFKKYVTDKVRKENRYKNRIRDSPSADIPYIEKLLKTKISDGRQRICNLVFLPYLINVKQLNVDDVTHQVYNYFGGHISKRDIETKAKELLHKKEIKPYNLAKMKDDDPELYGLIMKAIQPILTEVSS